MSKLEWTKREYREWAASERLVLDTEVRGYVGLFRQCGVLVRPGFDGSSPIGVQVEIELAHEDATIELIKPNKEGTSELAHSLADLFKDEDLVPHLLSISILATGYLLRFAALTDPSIVQTALDRLIDLQEARTRANTRANTNVSGPYR